MHTDTQEAAIDEPGFIDIRIEPDDPRYPRWKMTGAYQASSLRLFIPAGTKLVGFRDQTTRDRDNAWHAAWTDGNVQRGIDAPTEAGLPGYLAKILPAASPALAPPKRA